MEAAAPGRVRARNLLSSYYGVADEPQAAAAAAEEDDLNIDSSAFAVDKYVGTLLQYKSLEELVQRGNAMVSEIKSLDSDMQMLVYENYNKFISATDTIRQMKTRVEEMESQMVELEKNMGTISAASESVDSSLSARRGQLEKLNGAKKNLTKLQFLTELPARLQRCVREEELESAVSDFRKAKRILKAVGQAVAKGSFGGIQDEATTIMKRLAQALGVRLQQPALAPQALGATTKLLLQLQGGEGALLRDYLSRRRRALHEVLSSFSPPAPPTGADADGAESGESAAEGGAPAAAEADDEDMGLPRAASDVAQLGASFVPQLVELHSEWHLHFMPEATEPVLDGASSGGAAPLGAEAKEAMLLEALQELCGGYIEMCRRRLQEESVEPEQLLQGLRQLVGALEGLHEVVPQAKLMQRATRAAEQLAKRSMDAQLGALQQKLTALVAELRGGDAADTASTASMQEQLHTAGNAVAAHVRDALASTAPLLVPLCELLGLRADGMAKHLVARLYASLLSITKEALEPLVHASGVLLRAGLCLQMASTGVPQVPAMLKAQLSPHGLGGAALGFDSASMTREMQSSADQLLERFVEMQAQALSLEVTRRMERTDWLTCPTPHEVTHLVEKMLLELRAMQALAGHVLPGEPARTLLPQGPFPPSSSAPQVAGGRQNSAPQGALASSSAIQKDLQRMFARKISFSTGAFGSASGGKASVASMLTHVTKLTLKTLVEEVRLGTFSRSGFQQLQVDCAMLRWVLPPCVDDEGSVLALLDEALISCQERCLDAVAADHAVVEGLCDAKRRELLGRLG